MSKTSKAVKAISMTWPEREITGLGRTNVSEPSNEFAGCGEYVGDIPGTCAGDSISGVRTRGARVIGRDIPADPVISKPSHYGSKSGKDVIDWCEDFGLMGNAYVFNVFKYLVLAGKKTGNLRLQDVKEAQVYLDRYVRALETNRV